MAHRSIRQLVPCGLLCAAIGTGSVARADPPAEPALIIKPSVLATGLDVRLVAPDGRVTWSCHHSGDPKNLEPCRAPSGWHSQVGTYSLLASNETPTGDSVSDHDLDVAPGDLTVTWETFSNFLVHTRAGDPGIHVRASSDRFLEGALQNGSAGPLALDQSNEASLRIEHSVDAAWVPVAILGVPFQDRTPLAPAETRTFSFSNGIQLSEAGRYRFALDYRPPEATGKGRRDTRESVRLEVFGEPFDYRPDALMACRTNAPAPRILPMRRPPLRSILSTPAGILVLNDKGEILRVDDRSPRVIGHVQAAEYLSTPDAEHVLAHGVSLQLSEDGGRSFQEVRAPADPLLTIVPAGKRFFAFKGDGTALWLDRDGTTTPAALPTNVTWRAAAFRDDRHGVLLGACSVLAETNDGSTWVVRGAPGISPAHAAWDGGDLLIVTARGVFLRRSGQDAFALAVAGGICGLQSDPRVIVCREMLPPASLRRWPPRLSKDGRPDFSMPQMTQKNTVYVRRPDGAFEIRPLSSPEEWHFPWFVRARDGSLFGLYSAPSMVVHFVKGTPKIVLQAEDLPTASIPEPTEGRASPDPAFLGESPDGGSVHDGPPATAPAGGPP